jgi:hypothetical protein
MNFASILLLLFLAVSIRLESNLLGDTSHQNYSSLNFPGLIFQKVYKLRQEPNKLYLKKNFSQRRGGAAKALFAMRNELCLPVASLRRRESIIRTFNFYVG